MGPAKPDRPGWVAVGSLVARVHDRIVADGRRDFSRVGGSCDGAASSAGTRRFCRGPGLGIAWGARGGDIAGPRLNGTPNSPGSFRRAILSDGCLLLAAILWGSGFVVQRWIAPHLGPLTFNAARNLIALLAITPVVLMRWPRVEVGVGAVGWREAVAGALATGIPLAVGGWIQQAGIELTTAGNAGFVTGLYVVFVPVLAALAGARLPASTWPAAVLATVGLYLLSANGDWSLGRGDLLVLVSAVFWAVHVHAIGHFSRRIPAGLLTWLQLAAGTVLTLPMAAVREEVSWAGLMAVVGPLLYSGIVCGALAFTLQVAGQRAAPPAHAAVLLSFESVFAAVFGGLFLGERLGVRGGFGAALMLAGMLASQWAVLRGRRDPGPGAAPG